MPIVGTSVALLGFDMPREDCRELLGFSIHRVDHTESEAYYIEGMMQHQSLAHPPSPAHLADREREVWDKTGPALRAKKFTMMSAR